MGLCNRLDAPICLEVTADHSLSVSLFFKLKIMLCNTLLAFWLIFIPVKDSVLYDYVNKWKGIKYEYGKNDCSLFTQMVYCDLYNKNIPRTSKEQYRFTKRISKNNLTPGDLVFFHTFGKGVSHVGIYVGEGRFLHMSIKGVKISDLTIGFYKKHYIAAGRLK